MALFTSKRLYFYHRNTLPSFLVLESSPARHHQSVSLLLLALELEPKEKNGILVSHSKCKLITLAGVA